MKCTTVTLRDGRSFELDESNDVDWDNKGILIAGEGADQTNPSSWRMISWDDFREISFRSATTVDGRRRGS